LREAVGTAPRFYLDEDVPRLAAEIGRELGLDVISVSEAGRLGQPDEEQMAAAAAEHRILVTYNRNDFLAITRDAFAAGQPHAGVLILTYRLPRDAARIAHAIARWAAAGRTLQPYEVGFLSD
jgi:predicted nuclease of predicted toxin-antitoxin system